MPTLPIFDFRGGLDLSTPIEQIPVNASPSMRNNLLLPSGQLMKRRPIATQSFGVAVQYGHIESIIVDESWERRSLLANDSMENWTAAVLDSWTKLDAADSVTQYSTLSVAQIQLAGAAVDRGIYQDIPSVYSGSYIKKALKLECDLIYGLSAGYIKVVFYDAAGVMTEVATTFTDTAIPTVFEKKSFTVTLQPTNRSLRVKIITNQNAGNGGFCWVDKLVVKAPKVEAIAVVAKPDIEDYGGQKTARIYSMNAAALIEGDVGSTRFPHGKTSHAFGDGIVIFPDGTETDANSRREPRVIDDVNCYPMSASTTYAYPATWGFVTPFVANVNGADMPTIVAAARVGAKVRLFAANNKAFPSYLWWSSLSDKTSWDDLADSGSYLAGFMKVGNPFEAITGIAEFAGGIAVFKANRTYLVQNVQDAYGIVGETDVGCVWNQSIVVTNDQVYFYGRTGFCRLTWDGSRLSYEVISKKVERLARSIYLTRPVVGVFNQRLRKINWYASNGTQGFGLEYYLDLEAWSYTTYSTSAFLESLSTYHRCAAYSKINELVYIGANVDRAGFAPEIYKTDENITAVNPVDFSRKTPIIHFGDLLMQKDWLRFDLFYNCLAAQSSYPFTIIIDRNPLEIDPDISSGERYIRITNQIEVGNGSTWTVVSTTSGFALGDMTSGDYTLDHATKIYRVQDYIKIGKARSIQIEFLDNRSNTDFIIKGLILEIAPWQMQRY